MKTLHSCLNLLVLLSSIFSLSIAESNSANAQIIKDRLQQNFPVQINDSRIVQNSNATDLDREIVGKWVNNDSGTKGITRIIITKSSGRYFIQAFGKCHPTDCVWGERRLKKVLFNSREDVGANLREASAIANYNISFKKETLRISVLNGQMSVVSDSHFIDGSGRSDYTGRDYFRKDD